MHNVSVEEAKARLGELPSQVEAGEKIAITRRGQPVARLPVSTVPSLGV